jgi:phosphate transport system protein
MHWELEQLDAVFLRLTDHVMDMVAEAIPAFLEGDIVRAGDIIAGTGAVESLVDRILPWCQSILARYQPVARDLRLVLALDHMTGELERIDDSAIEISVQTRAIAALPAIPIPPPLSAVAMLVLEAVSAVRSAYLDRCASQARQVFEVAEKANALAEVSKMTIAAAMKAAPNAIEAGLCSTVVLRDLIEIVGCTTRLAAELVFLVEGVPIRHQRYWSVALTAASARPT